MWTFDVYQELLNKTRNLKKDHIIFKHRKKLLFPGIFSGNNFSRTEAGAPVTKFEHIILELLEPPRILL